MGSEVAEERFLFLVGAFVLGEIGQTVRSKRAGNRPQNQHADGENNSEQAGLTEETFPESGLSAVAQERVRFK